MIPAAALLLPALVLFLNRDEAWRGGWLQAVLGVLAGLAIVVGVVVAVVRNQARVRAKAPPGGWAGLAMVQVGSMADSPTLRDAAPQGGAIGAVIFTRGKMTGRLFVGQELRFEPGPRGRLFGAEPFSLSKDQLRDLLTKGRFLRIVIRGESDNPIDLNVVQPAGLREATRGLFRG